jgi:hypothetical protein
VCFNSKPDGPKGPDRRIDQGRGETIMRWHTTSMLRQEMPRGEGAMARSGRPQAALIIDLPVHSEPKRDPERWRS